MDERSVWFRPRAILVVLGVVVAAFVVLRVLWATRDVLVWVAIAALIAMALNPAVEALQSRGVRRGAAVGIVIAGAILIIVGIAALFVPTLVREVNDFAQAVPGYIDDLTKGRGRLGFRTYIRTLLHSRFRALGGAQVWGRGCAQLRRSLCLRQRTRVGSRDGRRRRLGSDLRIRLRARSRCQSGPRLDRRSQRSLCR